MTELVVRGTFCGIGGSMGSEVLDGTKNRLLGTLKGKKERVDFQVSVSNLTTAHHPSGPQESTQNKLNSSSVDLAASP